MNKSKKLVFAFFISTAIMSSKNMINTVHAVSDLPNIQSSAYTAVGNIFAKCGYTGQCTWFTYGRVLEKLGIALPSEFYGNAVDWWYANAQDNVYPYGSEPKANSIIVWGGGSVGYGHVGFVEEVDGDTIYFNEGNFSVRGSYDGNVKTISKEAIKNRGNLYLKGYIYVGEGTTSSGSTQNNSSSTSTNTYQPVSSGSYESGMVNISNTSSVLNIRNGAGTSFSILGYLKKGDTVQVVGTVGNWYKIKLNSSYGYVSSDYISMGNSSSTTNNATQQLSSNSSTQNSGNSTSPSSGYVKLSSASSTLNLRNSPQGAIIGSIASGTAVNIIGSNGGWYKVTVNGSTGYVYSSYISTSQTQNTSSTVAANTASTQTASSSKTGTVSLSNSSSVLNLRNNPWTGRVLTTLTNGSKVTILSTDGRWYKVQVGSTIGYVHSDYIKI
ncbi:SH3 domain-containing protein [Clostridium sp. WILCCON 0269]|uniref:N-acetylmuramoyl-L-alanine amidase n=1 Tax=Candidatus Clostridium eludens TaxID=3381663 RepID=A0ABW8SPL2_9CLOT